MKNLLRLAALSGVLCGSLPPIAPPRIASAAPVKFDPQSPLAKQARSAMLSAKIIVLGFPLLDDDSQDFIPAMQEFIGPFGGAQTYAEGLNFSDAVAYYKWRLANFGFERTGLTVRVYRDCFGRNPTSAEQTLWTNRIRDEKRWWFATLIPVFVKQLDADASEKKGSVLRSYRAGFGREATPGELAAGLKGNGRYITLRDARRNFLWSGTTEGQAELNAVLLKIAHKYYKMPATTTTLTPQQQAYYALVYRGNSGRKPNYQDMESFEITKKWEPSWEVAPVG